MKQSYLHFYRCVCHAFGRDQTTKVVEFIIMVGFNIYSGLSTLLMLGKGKHKLLFDSQLSVLTCRKKRQVKNKQAANKNKQARTRTFRHFLKIRLLLLSYICNAGNFILVDLLTGYFCITNLYNPLWI